MSESSDPSAHRTRLVVLYGGQSAEHEVSRISARDLLAAVDPDRYDVVPIGISKQGEWLFDPDGARALSTRSEPLPAALPVAGDQVDPLGMVSAWDPEEVVVVFPLLHGPMGEDGTVQGLLELAGVPYVGCGVLASALAMDKSKAKEMFRAHGIPQAAFVSFSEREISDAADLMTRMESELGFPAFVKPANMGSSIGVSKAHDRSELRQAIDHALTYDRRVIVEEMINGREIECAVLGNDEPEASVPGEIEPGADFYDYEDKYFDGTAKLMIPAPLDEKVTAELQTLAVKTFRALGCEGMARVDFFYDEGGRGLVVNEVNTIPGFTPISMYPKMWAATGLAYPALVDELIRLALERHKSRRRRTD